MKITLIDIDKWQEILSALRKNKLRTFLTAFGVSWGIFMLIIMLGSGNGLKNGTTSEMGDMATNSVFIWTNRTTIPYHGFPRGRYYNFTNEDIQAIKDNIPEVDIIAPRNQLGGHRNTATVVRGLKSGAFEVNGDFPEFNLIQPQKITMGRFINRFDILEKRKICVIGDRVREVLFENNDNPIGQYIRISGVYYKVVGVFTSESQERAERELQTIFVPFTTFQRAFNYGNLVGWFSITSKKNIPVSLVEKKVKALLARRHDIHPDDEFAFGSFNMEVQFMKMVNLFMGINILIWIVGIGTLMAGVIGVSNIMLVIVKERTREIGIRRAIGATPYKIINQVLVEAVFLTALAGYFGLLAGIGVIEAINRILESTGGSSMFFKNPDVDITIVLKALLILVFSGLLAGVIPARKAVSIKPIEAIREN